MKYTSLNNIGNKYPANELGVLKTELVEITPAREFSLIGQYNENRATYPSIGIDNINVALGTSFEFIVELNPGNLWTSDVFYSYLQSAVNESNPFFTPLTVPRVKLDYNFLQRYKTKNAFRIGEAYCEVEVTNTIDNEEKICAHIDWLVSKDVADIELRNIKEIGDWQSLYTTGSDFGLGALDEYDAMQKGNPDPEGYGAEIVFEQYDLTLPSQAQVTINQPVGLNLNPVEELVRIMANVPAPPGRRLFKPFGGALGTVLGAVVAGAAIILTGGAAALGVGALLTGAAVAGGVALGAAAGKTLGDVLGKNYNADGKYWSLIVQRENDRAPFESINKVFNREKDNDEKSWRELMVATGKEMKCTYTTEDVNAALKILLSLAIGSGDNNGTVRKSDYAYAVNVGNGTRWFRTNAVDKFNIKITL